MGLAALNKTHTFGQRRIVPRGRAGVLPAQIPSTSLMFPMLSSLVSYEETDEFAFFVNSYPEGATLTTNEDGTYLLTGIPNGTYDLSVDLILNDHFALRRNVSAVVDSSFRITSVSGTFKPGETFTIFYANKPSGESVQSVTFDGQALTVSSGGGINDSSVTVTIPNFHADGTKVADYVQGVLVVQAATGPNATYLVTPVLPDGFSYHVVTGAGFEAENSPRFEDLFVEDGDKELTRWTTSTASAVYNPDGSITGAAAGDVLERYVYDVSQPKWVGPASYTVQGEQSLTLSYANDSANQELDLSFDVVGFSPSAIEVIDNATDEIIATLSGSATEYSISYAGNSDGDSIAYRIEADSVVSNVISFVVDKGAPTLSSSAILGAGPEFNQIQLNFSESIQIGLGGSGGFSLTDGQTTYTLNGAAVAGNLLTLDINPPISIVGNAVLLLSYTQPGAGIRDASGNDLASFSNAQVTSGNNIPTAFSFVSQVAVPLSDVRTSDSVTVSGLDAGFRATVSLVGGEIEINDSGVWQQAPLSNVDVVNGDTFRVRHTSSSIYGTSRSTSVTISGVTASFTSTTLASPSTTYISTPDRIYDVASEHDGIRVPTLEKYWDQSDVEPIFFAWDGFARGSTIANSVFSVDSDEVTLSNFIPGVTVEDGQGQTYTAANGVTVSVAFESGIFRLSNTVTFADGRSYQRSVDVVVEPL